MCVCVCVCVFVYACMCVCICVCVCVCVGGVRLCAFAFACAFGRKEVNMYLCTQRRKVEISSETIYQDLPLVG